MTSGIRWYRRDDMDLEPNRDDPFRGERLREMVDELPDRERHIIERTVFGGASLLQAASELGIGSRNARKLRRAGLERLRDAVLADHAVGTVPSAFVGIIDDWTLSQSRDVAAVGEDAGPELPREDLEGPAGAVVVVPVGR